MFEGFEDGRRELPGGINLRVRMAGDGVPVLLLHGYPQTHICWHRVAPDLVHAGFRVIVPDLRGYGDSTLPAPTADHAQMSKRAMAADLIALMQGLGHARFHLVGHDRGGRVGHRLALDHPDALLSLSVLDIAPTAAMYAATDQAFATAYYHWFFLIQPAPLPERLIGAEPEFFLRRTLTGWGTLNPDVFSDDAMAEYLRAFARPEAIAASCEDYRAAASIDLTHDAEDADRKITCPLLALWGADGIVGRQFDPLACWQAKAENVQGHAIPGGHFLPEESPSQTTAALLKFLHV